MYIIIYFFRICVDEIFQLIIIILYFYTLHDDVSDFYVRFRSTVDLLRSFWIFFCHPASPVSEFRCSCFEIKYKSKNGRWGYLDLCHLFSSLVAIYIMSCFVPLRFLCWSIRFIFMDIQTFLFFCFFIKRANRTKVIWIFYGPLSFSSFFFCWDIMFLPACNISF